MTYPFVNIHTHSDNRSGISLFSYSVGEHYPIPDPPFTAGIHPWAVGKIDIENSLVWLQSADIVAIGEIGLDFSVEHADHNLQIGVFRSQLEIATERKLPVVIHCVRALAETVKILSGYTLKNVIFHSFIGNRQQTKQIVDLGYYISLGNTSLSSAKTVDAMSIIPLQKLFLETDAAHINIEDVYRIAASDLGITEQELMKTIYENYKTIFK